jgi:hypothetical protein
LGGPISRALVDGAAIFVACGNEEGANALVDGDDANRNRAARREKAGMVRLWMTLIFMKLDLNNLSNA